MDEILLPRKLFLVYLDFGLTAIVIHCSCGKRKVFQDVLNFSSLGRVKSQDGIGVRNAVAPVSLRAYVRGLHIIN